MSAPADKMRGQAPRSSGRAEQSVFFQSALLFGYYVAHLLVTRTTLRTLREILLTAFGFRWRAT